MPRPRWLAALLWLAGSAAGFAWSLIPAGAVTHRIALEPVDITQAVPAYGTGATGGDTSSQPLWTPALSLEETLPSRLRLGASEPVRLVVTAASGPSDRASLLVTATLHAAGAEVEPPGEISLPLGEAAPVHFDWSITASDTGAIWSSLSLRLSGVSDEGALLGERLVWADSTPLRARAWLGLSAPVARWGGLVSSLITAAVIWRMAQEARM